MDDLRRRYGELVLECAGFALLVASVTLLWQDNLLLLAVVGLPSLRLKLHECFGILRMKV